MRERRLRRLFARYAKSGDLEALGAVFDATAPGLAALARHLVGSTQNADDAVQATFLTAIERSPDYDPARPLEPWLTGILVRKARTARPRPASAAELEGPDEHARSDPARQASDAEFSEHLGRALSELPEPYRLVLRPFLQEGDRPRDIARRTGLAPGTIRVRIHRGLKLLRAALPAGYAATASAALPAPGWLAQVRSSVLEAARPGGSAALPGGGATAAAATAWGGPGAAVLAVTAALAGLGAWGWTRASRSSAPGLTVAAARPAPGSRSAVDDDLLPTAAPRAGEQGRTPAAPEQGASDVGGASAQPGWSLVATIRGLDVAAPDDLSLSVAIAGAAGPPLEAPIRGNGQLTVELPASVREASTLELRVGHEAFAGFVHRTTSRDLRAEREFAVDILLERVAFVIEGRVVPPADAGIDEDASPTVTFFDEPQEERQARCVAVTDCAADGSFRLVTTEPAGWVVVVIPGCAPAGVRLAQLASDVDLGLLPLQPGAAIEGFAYAADGLGVPGFVDVIHPLARSATVASLGGVDLVLLDSGVESSGSWTTVGPSGEFRIDGLTPGPYQVLFMHETGASGYVDPQAHGTRVEAPATDIELVSPIRVYSLHVVAEGEPLADAMVKFHLPTGSVAGPTTREGLYDFFMARSDEPLRVSIFKPGFEERELSLSPVDLERQVTVELERSAPASELRLDFTTQGGAVGRLGFKLSLVDSPWYLYRADCGAQVDLGEVPAGAYRLDVWPAEDDSVLPSERSCWLRTEIELACRPTTAERLQVPLSPGGRVLFHVSGRSEAGAGEWTLEGPDGVCALRLTSWDVEQEVATLVATEEIELVESGGEYGLDQPLPPGEYRLGVTLDGALREVTFRIEPGVTSDVFLDF